MAGKQEFSLSEMKWKYFPFTKSKYSVVVSLEKELSGLFGKYISELMPDYELINIDTKEKFDTVCLGKPQLDQKIYMFDFRDVRGGKFPMWEDIDRLDAIKYKIYLYSECANTIPKSLITRADLLILSDIKDYMSSFFSSINFTLNRPVVAFFIEKTDMIPNYYYYDVSMFKRIFKMEIDVE
jgi:hypothetical protein